MEWTVRRTAVLSGWIGFVGFVVFLALTVYPFDYAPVDGVLLSAGLLLVVLVKYALDTATLGAEG
ncbi:hypothetical protein [Halococcus agarilyticus]|uniref:hypothetical protein n=1 Tax=Halococcus agarilyticus TaxID=1232219 RepID=UPI000677E3D6|nr:hypothetical protein [Halococcus agarilyticus]